MLEPKGGGIVGIGASAGGLSRQDPCHEYPGSGMGLAICAKIVARYEGHIWVESTPDQGATFSFSLPDGQAG